MGHKLRDTIRLLCNPDPEQSGRRLIVFTRYPEPGRTKTRLIPILGPEGAAALHRRMTEHTLRKVRQFLANHPASLLIRYDGGNEEGLRRWLGADLRPVPQGEGDLGRRMDLAFAEAFAEGMRRVVLVGTDIPGIRPAHLARAFQALRRKDVVIGPARDGGYYLIGLNEPAPISLTGFRGEQERCCKEPWTLRQRATAGWRCLTLSKTWIVRRTSRSGKRRCGLEA